MTILFALRHFENGGLPGYFFGVSFSFPVWLTGRFADQSVGGVVFNRIADDCVAQGARNARFDFRQSLVWKTGESFFLGGQRSQIH